MNPWVRMLFYREHALNTFFATIVTLFIFPTVLALLMACSCVVGNEELRVYPGDMSFPEAREAKLTLNMSRALGHIILKDYGITPTPGRHLPCCRQRAKLPLLLAICTARSRRDT
ncbi:MAG TPA: hypothetical protein V6C97_03280 [Oculatellaceae cyanobacterium]